MTAMSASVFEPVTIGPLKLRNRTIRSAAFEGMSPAGRPSAALIDYHRSVAAGGIGMTTVAYAAVVQAGRTFEHQLWMRDDIVPELRTLTDAVHAEGAAVSIQLGHGGCMADKKLSGGHPWAPSAVFNLFGLAMPKAMTKADIDEFVQAYARSVELVRESGFDAVEVQVGHGYLVSQFLAPHTNRRTDEYGGSFENRTRLVRDLMRAVRAAAGNKLAVVVKTNVDDGFGGGMPKEELRQVAVLLEQEGADALVLSGGFVNKCPFYMLRGETPVRELISVQPLLNKIGLLLFRRILVKDYEHTPAFFLDDARQIRSLVKIPLVLVGGVQTRSTIAQVMAAGFDGIAMARALIREPDFVRRLQRGETEESLCHPCNKCVAFMYNGPAYCPDVDAVAERPRP
jgi:2,4-dienoyl-CoA reductase-like NADH-dependent reductase (Old Yellow Enzyme family)